MRCATGCSPAREDHAFDRAAAGRGWPVGRLHRPCRPLGGRARLLCVVHAALRGGGAARPAAGPHPRRPCPVGTGADPGRGRGAARMDAPHPRGPRGTGPHRHPQCLARQSRSGRNRADDPRCASGRGAVAGGERHLPPDARRPAPEPALRHRLPGRLRTRHPVALADRRTRLFPEGSCRPQLRPAAALGAHPAAGRPRLHRRHPPLRASRPRTGETPRRTRAGPGRGAA